MPRLVTSASFRLGASVPAAWAHKQRSLGGRTGGHAWAQRGGLPSVEMEPALSHGDFIRPRRLGSAVCDQLYNIASIKRLSEAKQDSPWTRDTDPPHSEAAGFTVDWDSLLVARGGHGLNMALWGCCPSGSSGYLNATAIFVALCPSRQNVYECGRQENGEVMTSLLVTPGEFVPPTPAVSVSVGLEWVQFPRGTTSTRGCRESPVSHHLPPTRSRNTPHMPTPTPFGTSGGGHVLGVPSSQQLMAFLHAHSRRHLDRELSGILVGHLLVTHTPVHLLVMIGTSACSQEGTCRTQ